MVKNDKKIMKDVIAVETLTARIHYTYIYIFNYQLKLIYQYQKNLIKKKIYFLSGFQICWGTVYSEQKIMVTLFMITVTYPVKFIVYRIFSMNIVTVFFQLTIII